MLISGHETRDMLERYNIVSLNALKDAAAKLDAWKAKQPKKSARRKVVRMKKMTA
jgi:hypothetical protein